MATKHENEVILNGAGGMIQSVSYEGQLHITKGQPYDEPPTITQNGNVWTITLNAGRQGSSDVAVSYNQTAGGAGHEYSPLTFSDPTPGELNFWFALNVVFILPGVGSTQTVTLYLGQGHSGASNNWWIGGGQVNVAQGVATLNLAASGKNVQIPITGSTYEFDFQVPPSAAR